ncbi:hypothetical protein HUK80_10595 [Flavobacterium sp. MAH-1]|uniref:Uncharacterized protein n=1 Tax=Flavobacterium agri TaxID=2743471 RepID=A0A7Y9C5U8_9FLAO|nr:hypothetical protein [Flavobacterium agri]NUY81346.1 hypothetical protein [Flavobacterium agri]NYA71370.1 hypothetical protein [Flavobacterium agri]
MHSIFTGSTAKKLVGTGIGLQPYVLDDLSLVLTKKSINRYFGHTGKSDWLNEYMHGFTRFGIGATGLLEQLSNPILFQVVKKDGFPTIEEAYSVRTLLDSCEFILFAKKEGFLSVIELRIAALAENILSAHRKEPFEHQITEITGLNHLKWKASQRIFDVLQEKQKEKAHVWIRGLNDNFWDFLLDQLQTDWKEIAQNPIPAANFIHEWVFGRLPEDLMEELRQSAPKRTYRSRKQPQRIEKSGLSAYLHALIGLYGVSGQNLSILGQLLDKSHPLRRSVVLPDPTEKPELPTFAKQLQEAMFVKK